MIEVTGVSFAYPRASRPAVNGLNFAIQPGEIFGFLGPSGAGKSTTQKILIGLLRGYVGQVVVHGRRLEEWGSNYYERVGVAFEVPNLFSKLTALENLRYFAALYSGKTKDPMDLLKRVALEEDAATPVGQFSKGMKNRLNVARCLLHNPQILFMDEPTSGLDPVNARRIKDLIQEQREAGRTVFLTTHNMNVAEELCDRVAFIVDGQINLIDAPRELKLRFGKSRVRVEYFTNGRLGVQDFPMEGLAGQEGFLSLLKSGSVQTIHTQEASLEDIFIQVTGRSLS